MPTWEEIPVARKPWWETYLDALQHEREVHHRAANLGAVVREIVHAWSIAVDHPTRKKNRMSNGNSGNTSKDWRDLTSAQARELAGKIRRMAVTVTNVVKDAVTTSSSFWQVVGHLLQDNTTNETADAEVFPGVGFYARPPAGANAEAIVAFPGGPSNPVVVASRDEDTRKKAAGGALQDETFVFNSKVAIRCTASGLVQVYLIGGPTPLRLALASDVDAVMTAYNAHKHTGVTTGGGVSGPPQAIDLALPAIGSSVLRG
jgi:phage gp45-like